MAEEALARAMPGPRHLSHPAALVSAYLARHAQSVGVEPLILRSRSKRSETSARWPLQRTV